MWEIYEHRSLERRLRRLPEEICKRYEKWKDIVRLSGPAGLKLIRGLKDEALLGQWKGHRSSRLGLQYRVIYRVAGTEFHVYVIEVTAHDYRRR